MSADASSDDLDWLRIGRALWRRKRFLLTFVLVVVGLTGAYLRFQVAPVYEADTVVMLRDQQPVIEPGAIPPALPSDTLIGNQLAQILSRGMAERLVQRLSLYDRPEFNPALREPGVARRWLAAAQVKLGWWLDQLPLAEVDAFVFELLPWPPLPSLASWRDDLLPVSDERPDLERAASHQELVNQIVLEAFGAEPESGALALRLSFRSTDRLLARDGADTLAKLYLSQLLELKQSASDVAVARLAAESARLRAELAAIEETIHVLREELRLIGPPIDEQQLSGLNAELVRARAEQAEAEARLGKVSSIDTEAAAQLLNTPVLNELRQRREALAREIGEQGEEYGERHPVMMGLRAQLAGVADAVADEVGREIQRLRNEVAAIGSREAALVAELGRLQGQLADRDRRELGLHAFEGERDALAHQLEQLVARSKELESLRTVLLPDADIVSPAALPLAPVEPRTPLVLGIALVGALFAGSLIVLGRERLDTSLRSSEQIEADLGQRSLGLIPAVERTRDRGPEDHVLDHPNSAFGEAIRRLRTELLGVPPQPGQAQLPAVAGNRVARMRARPKVLLLTSAIPGEGKTSTALCLARVHARSGRRTLLIDGDLRRPRLHVLTGVTNRAGLSEVLRQREPLEAAIQVDDPSGADLVTAGAAVDDPAALLGSAPMRMLLDAAARHYDLVILDSPPVLNLPDAQALAPLVDEVLLVTKWGATPRADVMLALKKLIEARADLSGVVLTQVDVREHSRYGYIDSGHYHEDKYTKY